MTVTDETSCNVWLLVRYLQTRGIHPMLFQCWSTVSDAGPTLKQHWDNAPCFLGYQSVTRVDDSWRSLVKIRDDTRRPENIKVSLHEWHCAREQARPNKSLSMTTYRPPPLDRQRSLEVWPFDCGNLNISKVRKNVIPLLLECSSLEKINITTVL